MSTVHAKTVITADDGVSEVGSDEWNAGHTTSIADAEVAHTQKRLLIPTTQRLSIANSARFRLPDAVDGLRGSFSPGSLDLLNDTWFLQYKRASLSGNARVSLYGTAELYIFDLAPVGRLVLAGRGG